MRSCCRSDAIFTHIDMFELRARRSAFAHGPHALMMAERWVDWEHEHRVPFRYRGVRTAGAPVAPTQHTQHKRFAQQTVTAE